MSRYTKSNGPPAVWTKIRNVTLADGQLVTISFSDGGAMKATYHTEKGEKQACMFPLAQLEILAALAPEFETLQEEYMSRKDAIEARKAEKDELVRIEKQKEEAMKRAVLAQHAAKQALDRANAYLASQGIEVVAKVK